MAATLTVSPTSGKVGDKITVVGADFGFRWYATITLDGTQVAKVKSSSTGSFTTSFNVPARTAVGAHIVKGKTRYRTAQTTLSVVASVPVPPPDPAPIISAITTTNITQTSFTINWHVSEKAQGWVEYGVSITYGHDTVHETSFNYQDHTQTASGLISNTLYHFRVHAVDTAGQHTISADQTVTTSAVIVVPPPPPPPPTSGTPPIPVGYGTKFKKNFADGTLTPFKILLYPNDHDYYTDPSQLMRQYCKYVADTEHISVHDGYLDLKCTRNPAVANPAGKDAWLASFVGTGLPTSPAPYKFQYGTARAMARMNSGKAGWNTIWYLVADSWSSPEIDWAEVIGSKWTANLHGSSSDGQKVSKAMDENWHEFGIVKAPTYIAFTLDGVEVGRSNVAMSANMALLADSKVGLGTPDATTPTQWLNIAWWTVD